MIEQTYLTTDELSAKFKYDRRTIRDRLKDSVLLEGRHLSPSHAQMLRLCMGWRNADVESIINWLQQRKQQTVQVLGGVKL
jgi:hypothetical protein